MQLVKDVSFYERKVQEFQESLPYKRSVAKYEARLIFEMYL